MGLVTGWFNLIGQIAVTAAIGYGLATFGTALLNFWFDYPNTKEYIFLLYIIFLVAALVINLLNVRITALLNTISAYWHMVGVALIVLVLAFVPDNHQSFSYVFTETVNATGFGGDRTGGFDLHLRLPDRAADGPVHDHRLRRLGAHGRGDAPGVTFGRRRHVHVRGRVGVFGFILLVAVTFAVPSTHGAIDNLGFIVPWIWSESMGQNWAEALLFICVVAQFFCVTASITSASRMLFAFSRDGAVPGHRLWRQVGRNRVPQLSVIAIVSSRLRSWSRPTGTTSSATSWGPGSRSSGSTSRSSCP